MYLSFFLSLYIYIYIYKLYTPVSRSNCLSVSTFCLLSFHLHLSNCSLPACLFFLFVCLLFICVPFSQSVFTLSLSLFLSLTHTYTHTHSLCLSSCLPPLFFTNQKNTIHFHISELRDCSIFKQLRYISIFQNYEIILRITRLFHF